MLTTHVSLLIFIFQLAHGNHYLGNTNFTLPLKVYETFYIKVSLDVEVENAEVSLKTFKNFLVC